MRVESLTKSGTKVIIQGTPSSDVSIQIPQGSFVGYWGMLGSVEGFVCRGHIDGKDTVICAQIPKKDWDVFTAGVKAELLANVPGLKDLQDAIDAEIHYAHEFEAMMDDEQNDGVRPPKLPVVKSSDIAALYPVAAAYIKAERYESASHYAKSSAGKKAKAIIAEGGDYKTAIENMEKEWSDYCNTIVD